ITDVRYRSLALITAALLGVMLLYYLIWRRGHPEPPVASSPSNSAPAPTVPAEATRSHEPQSKGPPMPAIAAPPPAKSADKEGEFAELLHRTLTAPIAGLRQQDIQDTYKAGRANGKPHEASDILAPRGTPVVAMEDGTIRKLFTSVPGGLTIYEFDPKQEFCYYYAHLDRYAEGIVEGMEVKRGTVIGYVGTTGNAPANTPHLHLAIYKVGAAKRWWDGVPINPYPVLKKLATG
ncbi:MAG: M23 family metallopeptidase, partial [Acidobacteriota bacterium]|nr:M23 family metallopeptidase [Acidobacteriota bacterium]